ncbi:DUF6630 family protein [Thermoflavimicrobium daqui]|uniref:DUF6630 domain-containing protein n=1 Tax=Thermoflavimicrobium daqui TaxID=2137476 RepID=A0A364K9W3_9BACL|nr:hypothetical protein [Thermoflavimicrobium daqui]RAL27085.1 hypothetical protein DL897_03365 [Thermoflavimicrobium daqui]
MGIKQSNESLLELCELILPEDSSLHHEVCLSMDQPEKYLELFPSLKIYDQQSQLPWFALLHGLQTRGFMYELTSRTQAQYLDFYPNSISSHVRSNYSLIREDSHSASEYAHQYINQLLSITSEYLYPYGYVLGEWTSPAHPSYITLMPRGIATKCRSQAKKAGYGEIFIHPSFRYGLSQIDQKISYCLA